MDSLVWETYQLDPTKTPRGSNEPNSCRCFFEDRGRGGQLESTRQDCEKSGEPEKCQFVRKIRESKVSGKRVCLGAWNSQATSIDMQRCQGSGCESEERKWRGERVVPPTQALPQYIYIYMIKYALFLHMRNYVKK